MKKYFLFILLISSFLSCTKDDLISCEIKTELGSIEIELHPKKAPITVANFMRYVDNHLYDSSSFFRTCTPENERG